MVPQPVFSHRNLFRQACIFSGIERKIITYQFVKEMEMSDYFAHTCGDKKEDLLDHLKKTADLAKLFTKDFGSAAVGSQIALLHDVGKHTVYFQEVLERKRKGIDHAIVGAEVYSELCGYGWIPNKRLALTICMCIACHHSVLHRETGYPVPTTC